MNKVEPKRQPKVLADQVWRRAGPRRGKTVFCAAGPDQRDQILDVLNRERWMDRQHRGRSHRNRYSVKILVGVVGYSLVHGRVDDDVWRNDQDRIAVGCGLGAL